MTATLPQATPIGWNPIAPDPDGFGDPYGFGSPTRHQPTLFDELTTRAGTAGRSVPDPELTARVRRLAVVTVEVLAGRRPPAQLARWTTESVQAQLTMAAHRNRGRLPLRVASVHCQAPSDEAVEAVLRIRTGPRSTAMAFRLEHRRQRWLCTDWELRVEDLSPK